MLCTIAQLKSRLEITVSSMDALLSEIVTGTSASMEAYAGRAFGKHYAAATELFDVGPATSHLWLSRWPIVSITSVKEALYQAFSTATALTVLSDYAVRSDRGRLDRLASCWMYGDSTVQVVYVGGYTLPGDAPAWAATTAYTLGNTVSWNSAVYTCILAVTSATVPAADPTHWSAVAGQVPLPADLVEAAIQQSSFVYSRRKVIGQESGGFNSSNWAASAPDELLTGVRAILDRYRRV